MQPDAPKRPSAEICQEIISACKKGDAGLEDLLSAIEKANAEVWPATLCLPHSCLFASVSSNSLEATDILIQNGVAMNHEDENRTGWNDALYKVVGGDGKTENLEMISLLLENGANPHALVATMHSALSYIIFCCLGDNDALNTVQLLVQYANVDDLNEVIETNVFKQSYTPLMIATARCSGSGIIRELIDAGATLVNSGKHASLCTHSNAIQCLVRHHPGSIENFKALLFGKNPFETLGNMSIQDSIDDSLNNYNCNGCKKCGADRESNKALLLNALEEMRVQFVKKNCYVPLLQDIPELSIIPLDVQGLIVDHLDGYEEQTVKYASEFYYLQILRGVLPFLPNEILLLIISFLELNLSL